MAMPRRLHPAPPAIKASAIVEGRILFATGFIFPFYSVFPDTLVGAVRCVSTGTPVTAHRSAPRYRAEIFFALFLFALCCPSGNIEPGTTGPATATMNTNRRATRGLIAARAGDTRSVGD